MLSLIFLARLCKEARGSLRMQMRLSQSQREESIARWYGSIPSYESAQPGTLSCCASQRKNVLWSVSQLRRRSRRLRSTTDAMTQLVGRYNLLHDYRIRHGAKNCRCVSTRCPSAAEVLQISRS